tara:strand:+ start:247 stop:411 length:165 start_codon:yes stop_codon:yes gene_type:complete
MPEELKPFMHIIYRLYINYGEKEYPICSQERITIDEKTILNYATDLVMRIQPRD